MSVPRMRIFAGPNGSGKSTIKASIPEIIDSKHISIKTDQIPYWFQKFVLEKLT